MSLEFTAVNEANELAKPDKGGSVPTLTVAKDANVTFTLKASGAIDAPKISRQEGRQEITEFEIAGNTASAKYRVTNFGTFVAEAKVDGVETAAPSGVKLVEKTEEKQPKPQVENQRVSAEDSPSEVEIGELDRPFAYVTLAFVAVVTVAIAIAVWSVISRVHLPAANALVADGQTVDGMFGQRAGFIGLVVAAGVGAILLVIGAWLASLETRGRLRVRVSGEQPPKRGIKGPISTDVLNAVEKILDKLRRMRGSIAVVSAGLIIVVLATWGFYQMAAMAPSGPSSETDPTTDIQSPQSANGLAPSALVSVL